METCGFHGILKVTQYQMAQGGSMQIHTANQQQIGQPKLGGKSVSARTQQSTTKCRGSSTGPKGNRGTEPTLLTPQS
jgi:hypothetical protein